MTQRFPKILALLLLLALAACAYNETFVQGRKMVESGHEEEGLALVEQAARQDPDNLEVKNYYLRHRSVALERFLQQGDAARGANAFDQAEAAYRRALGYDPENARAKAGLEALAKDRQSLGRLAEADAALKAGDYKQALDKAKQVLADNPQSRDARAIVRKVEDKAAKATPANPELNAKLKKPITMEFRDAPLRTVFELISKKTGLNFVFDRDVPPDAKATVFARNTSIEEVMRFVLVTNQLERKVMNDNTVLIYPNTPAKAHDYKDLIVKSFYLANADVKQTANMIRQVVKTRDLYVDEKMNLLVMRDTPEAIRVAEKLVANQDMAEPEVVLEMQVLEVGYSHLQQLGIQLPTSLSLGLMGAGGVAGQITGTEAKHLNAGLFRLNVPDPLVAFNFSKQDGRTNLLANPRVRVKNREKAHIHVGDRVPVVTTTAGATGFVSESVNYLDVGLKLDVEPQVFLDDNVGIKVGLEVSNVSNQIKTSSGTLAYQLGTRNATTTLRLRDGETQVLAGLINDEDRRTSSGVPGISDAGILGRLFSNNGDTVNKTEVVLLITPHVVRNIETPGAKEQEFNSGTEAEVGSSGGGSGMQSFQGYGGNPPPPVPSAPAPAPAPAAPASAPAAPSNQYPPQPPAAGPNPPALKQ